MVNNRPYPRIFVEANGPGPWPCYVCGSEVVRLIVHHLDENPRNDDPRNLVAIHRSCHASLHHAGKPKSAEHRAALSESSRGRKVSAETRALMSAAKRGKPQSELHKQHISEALRGRVFSDEHKRKISEAKRRKPTA